MADNSAKNLMDTMAKAAYYLAKGNELMDTKVNGPGITLDLDGVFLVVEDDGSASPSS